MKIGPKIALFYSLITMCAIIMVMSVFYLFSSRYINRLYESYLREKAFITAQKYWEKDEVDEQSYRLIQQKYDELLPQAREVLLNMDTSRTRWENISMPVSRKDFFMVTVLR